MDQLSGEGAGSIDLELLRKAALLSGLTEEEISKIARIARMRRYPQGTRLFSMGEQADTLYLIGSGRVDLKIPVILLGTSKELSVETLTDGQAIGWSALVPPHTLTMSAVISAESTLISLSRRDLQALFSEDTNIGWKVLASFAGVIGQRLSITQAMLVRQLQGSLDHGLLNVKK